MWDFPLWPDQASSVASRVDAVYLTLIAVGGGVSVLVAIVLIVFAVKYRAGSHANRRPGGHLSWLVEATWIVLPTIALIGVFIWAAALYFDMMRPPPDAMDIFVVGKQWMWKAQHPSGQREINELHVPLGQPVKVTLTSQDVIHSFFIPAFRVKMDALPQRYTSVWFTPTKVGEYHLYCAEFCGTDHARMKGRVVVMEPADYQAWLGPGTMGERVASVRTGAIPGAASSLQLAGEGILNRAGCTACHVPDSTVRAPRLDGLFGAQVKLDNGQTVVADEQYLREAILQPNAKITAGYAQPSLMPTYEGQLSEEELAGLISYIKSLRVLREEGPTP